MIGIIFFFVGALYGKIETELKDSQLVIERQKEDYESDLECYSELPAPDDPAYWDKLHSIC